MAERKYFKHHSFGRGSKKVRLGVYFKKERRNVDSLVPYCDVIIGEKVKGTMRVNSRGNNKKTYKTRDLIHEARTFYVENIVERKHSLDTIALNAKKVLGKYVSR